MRYGITRLAAGESPFVEISEEQFRAVRIAKDNFLIVVGIEEKFDLLLENHFEFERELQEINLRRLIFRDSDWFGFRGASRLMTRRLSNLLSSAKLYIDQVGHDVKALLGPDDLELAQSWFRKAYDSSFSYRLMEELRKHCQHRGLPVRSLSYSSGWHRDRSPVELEYRVFVHLNIELLAGDKKFKQPVLKELRARDNKDGIVSDLREYLYHLSVVHEQLRLRLSESVALWDRALRDVIEIAKLNFPGGEIIGLGVVAKAENDTYAEHEEIFEDMVDYLQLFRDKNGGQPTLNSIYASGRSMS